MAGPPCLVFGLIAMHKFPGVASPQELRASSSDTGQACKAQRTSALHPTHVSHRGLVGQDHSPDVRQMA